MKTTALFLFFILSFAANAQVVNIPDPVFKQRLIDEGVDTNWDGEIQVSEAEAVTGMLDVNGQFEDIYDLTGIEAFINITGLDVWHNQLTTLDLSNNTALIELNCIDNNLTYLNVENCINLEQISAYHNQLTSVDLSQNTNLKVVSLYNNQLTSIDLTSNVNLEQATLGNNQLTFLDLTHNSELVGLSCENNSLVHLDVRNDNNTHFIYFYSIDNPNLTCIFVDDAEYSESSPDWYKDPASTYVETQAECDALDIDNVLLNKIQIFPNPIKNKLYIDITDYYTNIQITVMDAKGNEIIKRPIDSTKYEIDISYLQSGIYFIVLKDQQTKETLTKKLIKL